MRIFRVNYCEQEYSDQTALFGALLFFFLIYDVAERRNIWCEFWIFFFYFSIRTCVGTH